MSTPPSQTGKELSEQESQSFLSSRDNGVLSLGVDNCGYGFPISYTYDEQSDSILFGFVASQESKKREFANTTAEATLTVYTHEDVDSWRSVIVTGPIRSIDTNDSSHRVPDLFFQQESDDASEDGLTNLDEFERSWYEIQIETLTGRHSGE